MSNRPNDAFQNALDEAASNDRAEDARDAAPAAKPRVRGVAFAAPPGAGGEARFGLALDWTDEHVSQPAPPQPAPRRSPARSPDTPTEIAAELGLGEPATLDEITSRWRDFVWRNHPDRLPLEAWAQANARVAIANTLYDRARRDFGEGARRRSPSGPPKRQ